MRKLGPLVAVLVLLALGPSGFGQEGLGPGIGPDASGALPPVSQPPWPDRVPGYTELDPSTGLHMTGTPQRIELALYRLRVSGKVDRPLSLSFDEIRRLPRLASKPALICQGYFEDYANWAGASLQALLERAGVGAGARQVELIGADGYSTSVSLAEARSKDAYLAYELEGRILPVLHGFPLRAVFPGLQGNKWAKWITEIKVN
jgi:DMSO/TMAO reductase YedYZ molybdopterin-dependent catalytic subunit